MKREYEILKEEGYFKQTLFTKHMDFRESFFFSMEEFKFAKGLALGEALGYYHADLITKDDLDWYESIIDDDCKYLLDKCKETIRK